MAPKLLACAAMIRAFVLRARPVLLLWVLAGCEPSPSAPPPELPSLTGRTTMTLPSGSSVAVPLRLVVVTFDGAPQADDPPALLMDASAFVAHLNALYARAPLRFDLRALEHMTVPWETWQSHVRVRTLLPPAPDPHVLTLYIVPSLSDAKGSPLNGMVLGPNALIVSLTASLRAGGPSTAAQPVVTEPVVRVSGHLVGSLLGLQVSEDPKNLMANGTTGTDLSRDQLWSLQIPTDLVER
jgi:hypothetical protein